MTPSPPVAPRRRWRRPLFALAALVALDQLLLWSCLTRPAGNVRDMIEPTNEASPPYFQLRRGLTTSYTTWGRGTSTAVHTNALGFRDPERTGDPAADRPVGIRRVLIAGDSITFGIGVNDEESFPRRLQALVDEGGARDIEIWNTGVPAYAMADHLGLLRRRLLALKPDLIVLQLSRNDNALPMPLGPTFLSAVQRSGFARAWMIVRLNFVEDTGLFTTSFAAYVGECERAGVKLLVVHEGLPEENRDEVVRLTGERAIRLVEIGGDAYPKLPDDPHYDAEGNRRVAARLLPEVLSAFGAR